VVHSGAKTVSNPSGLPASAADLNAMVAALQAAYAGSDLRSNQGVSALLGTSSGSFASFGTSLVSAQLGGTASVATSTVTTSSNYFSGAGTSGNPWIKADVSILKNCQEYNFQATSLNNGSTR
jgi:hypothetical protein